MGKRVAAVVAHGAGDLRVEARALPTPQPHEAVIDIAFGGICGSDLHYWRHGAVGESILRSPMVLGHEVSGIVAVAAADGSGPQAGSAVAVHPGTPHSGREPYPADRPNLAPGGTYLGSAARVPHTDGAFASSVVLPTRMLRPLPPGLDLRTAAIAEPAAVAWHAVSRAGEVRGRRALVIGAGPIGALIVAVLRRAGADEITVTDLTGRALAAAEELGATRTLLATDAAGIINVGAEIVFESSGTTAGLSSAIRGARRGARVVLVGLLPPGDQAVPIALAITRELDLMGSFRFIDEIDLVLSALADGSLRTEAVVTHEFAAADALEAFRVAADPSASGKVLLRFSS